MLNERYRLIAPRQLRIDFVDEVIGDNDVVVRPTLMAICAADQRYYQGLRAKEILDRKLPLALIHEAVGTIVYDPRREFPQGTKAVLIPNEPRETDPVIKENYLRSSASTPAVWTALCNSWSSSTARGSSRMPRRQTGQP